MAQMSVWRRSEEGFSLHELMIVLVGGAILLSIGVPIANSVSDQHRLMLAAHSISTQMLFARMKAVSSNESIQVNFPAGQNLYRVETSTGEVIAGPFTLPNGIAWNSQDFGSAVTFPGNFVTYMPTGNVPLTGNGSVGRVKIRNQAGVRVDVVISSGGIVRQTPFYKTSTPPF